MVLFARCTSKQSSMILVIAVYLVAGGAAVITGHLIEGWHPVTTAAAGCLAATLIIYLFSQVLGNSSFFDPYWSVAPLGVAAYWLMVSPPGSSLARQITVALLVGIWALRLTCNWAIHWRHRFHEDWRYTSLRHRSGTWFWLVNLAGIQLFPAVIVFLACLPLYPALTSGGEPPGWLDFLALAVTAGALFIESVADVQLGKFRRSAGPVANMDSGLWAYSRHPNYLGEVIFWWGIYMFGLAASPYFWWTVIGPVSVTLLFLFISIPMMEKRNLSKRPGYREYQKKVPALMPRLFGRA